MAVTTRCFIVSVSNSLLSLTEVIFKVSQLHQVYFNKSLSQNTFTISICEIYIHYKEKSHVLTMWFFAQKIILKKKQLFEKASIQVHLFLRYRRFSNQIQILEHLKRSYAFLLEDKFLSKELIIILAVDSWHSSKLSGPLKKKEERIKCSWLGWWVSINEDVMLFCS